MPVGSRYKRAGETELIAGNRLKQISMPQICRKPDN
jgi:hypothetical protein